MQTDTPRPMFDTDELVINMGPQHPSTHGVLRLVLRLDGEKVVVFNGANADQLIVSARTSGAQSDESGISLFLVPADAPGIEKLGYRMMDGQLVANLVFTGVEVPAANLVGQLDEGFALMQALETAPSGTALGALPLGWPEAQIAAVARELLAQRVLLLQAGGGASA